MNLDDLMEVWRSQDAAPLHGVNETLLRLALRQDQAKLQAQRRRDAWIMYIESVFFIAAMAFFLLITIYRNDGMIGWDLAIPIVGAAAALLMGVGQYLGRRAQVRREQRFGDSLRDQLGRRIAQLDDATTRGNRRATVLLIAIFVATAAFLLATMRVNNEAFDDWSRVVRMILVGAFVSVIAVWTARRWVKQDVLPRKRRLEALLKELDGQ
jgi:4-amino-4-deoxy-L-arabinose transferase-like glycosyltransferase